MGWRENEQQQQQKTKNKSIPCASRSNNKQIKKGLFLKIHSISQTHTVPCTLTGRFSTHAHEPHTQASRLTIRFPLQVAYWEEEKNPKPKEADQQQQKKLLPKQTQQKKINPHLTPQVSLKSNRKGAFTSEVKGRCVSSGDPRCSISLEFVKDSGRAGDRRRDGDI